MIVVAAGSIRFGLPSDGRAVELVAGDRLELPAGTAHDAVVGPIGVTCLEAHVPAGIRRFVHHLGLRKGNLLTNKRAGFAGQFCEKVA